MSTLASTRGARAACRQRAAPPPARRLVVARFRSKSSESSAEHFPIEEGLPLSLFHPYKSLPAEGTTVPVEEEMCDPYYDKCKTPLHVYEAKCTGCTGSGWSRGPANGRRGHIATCLICHGLGYVRRTTSRFEPGDPERHHTLARPLMWRGRFAAKPGALGGSVGSSPDGDDAAADGHTN